MKLVVICSILLPLLVAPLFAEEVVFDGRYSVRFPDGWKEPAEGRKDALVYRETEAGDASFAIAKLSLPAKASADLKGTIEAMVASLKKGMEVLVEPKITEGLVDGKKALFAQVLAKTGGHKLGFYLVAVDADDRVFVMQATLPATASDQSRTDCMQLIKSFKEKR